MRGNQEEKAIDCKYPSAELMLAAIQREYEYESNRVRSLESRTGIFLAFAGALLVFFSSSLKPINLKEIEVDSLSQAFPFILMIGLIFLTLLILILSVIFFVRVISIQTYKRLSLNGFIKENTKSNPDIIAMEIMIDYQKVVSHNSRVNNKKIELYKKGLYLILMAIIMTAIVYSINLFI